MRFGKNCDMSGSGNNERTRFTNSSVRYCSDDSSDIFFQLLHRSINRQQLRISCPSRSWHTALRLVDVEILYPPTFFDDSLFVEKIRLQTIPTDNATVFPSPRGNSSSLSVAVAPAGTPAAASTPNTSAENNGALCLPTAES